MKRKTVDSDSPASVTARKAKAKAKTNTKVVKVPTNRPKTKAATMDPPLRNIAKLLIASMEASETEIVRRFARLPGAMTIDLPTCSGPAVYVKGSRTDKQGRVCLVAHYDTVWGPGKACRVQQDGYQLESKTIKGGIGADDRAGCAALWLLKDSGHDILIVPDEEIGCKGSAALGKRSPDLLCNTAFFIQFDRRGARDLVYYSCDNEDFCKYMRANMPGYGKTSGSFSDICELMPTYGAAGVNISIGFECEHTEWETLDILDFCRTVYTVAELLKADTIPSFAYHDAWTDEDEVWNDISKGFTAFKKTEKRHGKADKGNRSDPTSEATSGSQTLGAAPDNDYDFGFDEDDFDDDDIQDFWCHGCSSIYSIDTHNHEPDRCTCCGSNDTERLMGE